MDFHGFSWKKSSKSSYRFQSPFQFFLLQNPSESQQPISARLEILNMAGPAPRKQKCEDAPEVNLAGSSYNILIHFGLGHETVQYPCVPILCTCCRYLDSF